MSTVPDPAEVLREHASLLARIATSYERDPALREDLTQEIAISVWTALSGWRREAPLHCFVARIAHRRGVDHVARQVRQHRGREPLHESVADTAPSPADALDQAQSSQRLLEAIHALPLSARQVMVLALEGFSQREIGQALGIAENTVAQRISRARKQMRQQLETNA